MPCSRLLVMACASALVLAPASAASAPPADPWPSLHRRLHLPRVTPGTPCPRTPGGRSAPLVAFTLGAGPVYPVLGFSAPPPAAEGVVTLDERTREGGFYRQKTLWVVSARYRGPVLVRGRRIDGPGVLQFWPLTPYRRELRIRAGGGSDHPKARGWRYAPAATLLAGPGCFAFQIDGIGFSRVIVFRAVR
jgi:hypothetical protein